MMSANDYTNFPPGTHMLNDRMSLVHSHFHTKPDFDIEDSNGKDKKEVVLNPTPSDDPDDPLVGQTSFSRNLGSYHELNKNLELVHPEKNSELRTHLYIRLINLCPA